MVSSGIMARQIGSVGPSLGKYTFNRDGGGIGLTGFFRATVIGGSIPRQVGPATSYLDIRADQQQIFKHCSYPRSAVIIDSALLPQPLAAGLASASDSFPACFDKYCRWLIFLPQIEEAGKPVAGFQLAMAGAAAGEVETFLSGIDPVTADRLMPDIEQTIFLNPSFARTIRDPDLFWVATIARLTGEVMRNYWSNPFVN